MNLFQSCAIYIILFFSSCYTYIDQRSVMVWRRIQTQRLHFHFVLNLWVVESSTKQALETRQRILRMCDFQLFGGMSLKSNTILECNIRTMSSRIGIDKDHLILTTTTQSNPIGYTYGVIRSEYSLSTISMPPCLAIPIELLKLPISKPTTDILYINSLRVALGFICLVSMWNGEKIYAWKKKLFKKIEFLFKWFLSVKMNSRLFKANVL